MAIEKGIKGLENNMFRFDKSNDQGVVVGTPTENDLETMEGGRTNFNNEDRSGILEKQIKKDIASGKGTKGTVKLT
jgi:hypothetical protein